MGVSGKNAFDNAGRCQEVGTNSCVWQGDLKVTGTIDSAGGGETLANNTYISSENAAGSAAIGLIKADATDNTVVNAATGKSGKLSINSVAILTWAAGVFAPVVDGAIALGTSALGFGTLFLALGKTVQLKAGANAKAGTFTANGVTPVTVSTTAFVAGSAVIISLKTVGGTVGAIPHLETATAGTGFTVIGTALDTSVYNWAIIDQA